MFPLFLPLIITAISFASSPHGPVLKCRSQGLLRLRANLAVCICLHPYLHCLRVCIPISMYIFCMSPCLHIYCTVHCTVYSVHDNLTLLRLWLCFTKVMFSTSVHWSDILCCHGVQTSDHPMMFRLLIILWSLDF